MESQELKSFAQLLLNHRLLNKIKQKDMAELLSCTQSQYSKWENGKIKPRKLRELAIREIVKII